MISWSRWGGGQGRPGTRPVMGLTGTEEPGSAGKTHHDTNERGTKAVPAVVIRKHVRRRSVPQSHRCRKAAAPGTPALGADKLAVMYWR